MATSRAQNCESRLSGGGEVARMSGRQKSEDLQKLGEGKAHTRYEIGGLNQVNEISEEWRDIG